MDRKEPNLKERVLFLFSPKRAEAEYQERQKATQNSAKNGAHHARVTMGGYGQHGASKTLNSMIGWILDPGSAEDDNDLNGAILRQRSRDLHAGGGLGRSAPETLALNVVAWGIQPKPKIDGEALGMSEDACIEWERKTLREWRLWADNVMCDASRQLNFYGLQNLAFKSQLISGDVFCLFVMKENKRTPYKLALRLLEADRISTPDSNGDSTSQETSSGGRIVDGVEIDKDGAVVKYHITNRHPLLGDGNTNLIWQSIDAFGKQTGMPNILHVVTLERPEQRRGIPFVSSQIEHIKQLDRYITSELAANVVSSMLTAFITSEDNNGINALEDAIEEDEKVTDSELQLELAPGAVYNLPPGKKITNINPIRNNTAFEKFVDTLITTIGAGYGIPKEVILKKYESNYTAARASLLDFWRKVRVCRTDLNRNFNQPCYEQWLAEAVATGRIEAPGFFDDPITRQAWCGCLWMGASMGHVDPLKEVNAAEKRISNNITTQEQEAMEYNGNDWVSNVRQRKVEIETVAEMLKNEKGGDKGAS